jgi:hypothetical protein
MGRETNPVIFDAPQTPQEETGRAFDPLARCSRGKRSVGRLHRIGTLDSVTAQV